MAALWLMARGTFAFDFVEVIVQDRGRDHHRDCDRKGLALVDAEAARRIKPICAMAQLAGRAAPQEQQARRMDNRSTAFG